MQPVGAIMEMTKITKNHWLLTPPAPSLLKDTPNGRVIEVGKKKGNERKGATEILFELKEFLKMTESVARVGASKLRC